MFPAVAKWKKIGIWLGLSPGTLEIIEKTDDCPTDRMTAVLTNWLRENYNVERFGEPTWRIVVQVMAHPAAGNNKAHALCIAREHPGNLILILHSHYAAHYYLSVCICSV